METETTDTVPVVNGRTSRMLAFGAIAGPIVFELAWFILGFVSPGYSLWGTRIAPYSAISQPVSGLGLGLTAPFMNAAFVLSGVLLLVGVTGIVQSIPDMPPRARWVTGSLLALSPLGGILCGIFTLESMMFHSLGFLLALGSPVASFLVCGIKLRQLPRWRTFGSWLLLGSPLTLVLLVLFLATFQPAASGAGLGAAGLTQRALIVEVHAWFVAFAWLAWRGER